MINLSESVGLGFFAECPLHFVHQAMDFMYNYTWRKFRISHRLVILLLTRSDNFKTSILKKNVILKTCVYVVNVKTADLNFWI